jgi:hypothetical protein
MDTPVLDNHLNASSKLAIAMAPARLSFADLMETARSFPQEVRADPNRLTFTMAVTVIRHFFGKEWCEDHIIQDAAHSRPAGFLD